MRVLVLSDGKAGDEMPCRGVAEGLSSLLQEPINLHIERICPRPPYVWLPRLFGVDPRLDPRRSGSSLFNPAPDIVIASGRRTVPTLMAFQRCNPPPLTVYLKDPRVGRRAADVIWVNEHDRLRGDNVVVTLTSPHCHGLRIAAAREREEHAFSHLKSPVVGVLLGGDSRHHYFTSSDIDVLVRRLSALLQQGFSLAITTSRRTPPALISALHAALDQNHAFIWTPDQADDIPNPYGDILAFADSFVVTADSTNMVSEALAAGRLVYVFEPTRVSQNTVLNLFSSSHSRITTFLSLLIQRQLVRPFHVGFQVGDTAPVDATMTVAAAVLEAFQRRQQSVVGE